MSKLKELKLKKVNHPPYSPDLAPCDFRIFPDLSRFLRGKRFKSDLELQDACGTFFETRPQFYWKNIVYEWLERCEKCFRANGEYFEQLNINIDDYDSKSYIK